MILLHHRIQAGQVVTLGAIDGIYSAVWTERWQDYGEAEVVLPPGSDVRAGDVLTMPGRPMAVRVVGRAETESRVTLRCADALSYLDKRILYPTFRGGEADASALAEAMLRHGGVVEPATPDERVLSAVKVGPMPTVGATMSIQRSYKPLGQALIELGRLAGFDPYCSLDGTKLAVGIRLPQGSRSWTEGGGLAGWQDDYDESSAVTTPYVGGQVVDGQRVVAIAEGGALSDDARTEYFVDRRDMEPAHGLTRQEVDEYGSETYSGPKAYTVTSGATSPYTLEDVVFQVTVTAGGRSFTARLPLKQYSTSWSTIASHMDVTSAPTVEYTRVATTDTATAHRWKVYYASTGSDGFYVQFADLDNASFDMSLGDYEADLRDAGLEAVEGMEPTEVFEAFAEALEPYRDYQLGDVVTVVTRTGIRRTGVVKEVVESWDADGYRATPTLEMRDDP